MADMNQKDDVVATGTEEIMVDNAKQALITPHSKYSPKNHFEDQIQAQNMADMNQKDDVVATETEEIMVDNAKQAPITPHSKYSPNNHFEDQIQVRKMANMNQKDDVVATETEEIMVDNAEQAPITPHSKYSPNNHFEDQIQARKMADMNQKDDVVATETEEIMVDNAEQAPITPHSKYSPNNHFEDQIQARKMADMNQKDDVVATETEEIMVDNAEQAPITAHSKYSPYNHFEDQIQARKMADMNQKDDVVATETEEIMVDNTEQDLITSHSKYSPNNHFEDQIQTRTDMNQKDDVVATEIEEIMVDNTEQAPITAHSQYSPNNHFEVQMVEEVIIDLQTMLLDLKETPLSTSCCIYRVPHDIREQNAKSYTPKVVSIGPFHYGNPRLQNMEKHKQMYFKGFIEREHLSTILDVMVSFVKKREQRIRACYSENIELSDKELVKVILVDAIFIIELFLRKQSGESLADDVIFQNPWFMGSIEVDLLLYENQLPFFILEDLFDMSFPSDQNHSSFLTLTLQFFWYYNTLDLKPSDIDIPIKHFTDLFRSFHFRPNAIVDRGKKSFKDARCHNLFHSASELNELGVDLRANKKDKCLLNLQFLKEAGVHLTANKDKCLLNLRFSKHVLEIPQILNLRFSKHVLEIPQILVDDSTEILFRNLIAFEQCHCSLEANIIGYLFFLDNLINTSKDVDVLVHNGIINNNLGDSNDVALLFNGLCKDILRVHIPPDYQDICRRLNEFCTNPWNKKMASLKRDYGRTPWQTAASTAAIVLIILTIVQTICSIIQVVQK